MALGPAAHHHHLLVLLQRRDKVDLARVRARVGARVRVRARVRRRDEVDVEPRGRVVHHGHLVRVGVRVGVRVRVRVRAWNGRPSRTPPP